MNCCGIGIGSVIGKAVIIGAIALGVAATHQQLKPIQTSLVVAPSPGPAPARKSDAPGTPKTPDTKPTDSFPIADVYKKPAGAAPSPADEPANLKAKGMITIQEAREIFDAGTAQWVDARTPEEYAKGRIGQDTFQIGPDSFYGGKIPDPVYVMSREQKVVVYCGGGSCDASLLVALRLREVGFKDVVVFKDGWDGWTKAGHPVIGSAAPANE